MITLGTFRPEFFNNNGDQGNLEVLQAQLAWRGVDCRKVDQNLGASDFLLIGDASRAAMRHFERELLGLSSIVEERLTLGAPTLIVGSAFEFFAGKVAGLPTLRQVARASEFRTARSGSLEAFGYRNSEADLDLFVSGGFIATTLFGPVLAKSPDLLELILDQCGVAAKLSPHVESELGELVLQAKKTNAG